MRDFKLFPGVNLAGSLNRTTGMGFENVMNKYGEVREALSVASITLKSGAISNIFSAVC
ncbi:MAG: hypothetical protein U9R02_08265 [Thermodesulfobacteriota bacterium]|nr:hypothetical protein [Thermodesulfobacteriota bacterium]